MSYNQMIGVVKYEDYCHETYRFILRTGKQQEVTLSPSVHKLLAHTGEWIKRNGVSKTGFGT